MICFHYELCELVRTAQVHVTGFIHPPYYIFAGTVKIQVKLLFYESIIHRYPAPSYDICVNSLCPLFAYFIPLQKVELLHREIW